MDLRIGSLVGGAAPEAADAAARFTDALASAPEGAPPVIDPPVSGIPRPGNTAYSGPNQPFAVRDAFGNQVMTVRRIFGQGLQLAPLFRPRDGLALAWFFARGEADAAADAARLAEAGATAQGGGSARNLAILKEDLAHFGRGGAWDQQRIGEAQGEAFDQFRDYAGVVIGAYCAARGIPLPVCLSFQVTYAITQGSQWPGEKLDDGVSGVLPERNVDNTTRGYVLYAAFREGTFRPGEDTPAEYPAPGEAITDYLGRNAPVVVTDIAGHQAMHPDRPGDIRLWSADLRPIGGHDLGFFADAGIEDAAAMARLQGPAAAAFGAAQLRRFAGGEWDQARIDRGPDAPPRAQYRDYANRALGVYAASRGIPYPALMAALAEDPAFTRHFAGAGPGPRDALMIGLGYRDAERRAG